MNKLDLLKNIKLVITDIDGVLTDGGLYYTAEGLTFKRFYVRDGMGVVLLRKAGIETAIISGDNADLIQTRANKLKINLCYLGIEDKSVALNEIMQQRNLKKDEIAFIGDDVNDLVLLPLVGFKAAPADAHKSLLNKVDYICQNKGGYGAFRELVDLILEAKGIVY